MRKERTDDNRDKATECFPGQLESIFSLLQISHIMLIKSPEPSFPNTNSNCVFLMSEAPKLISIKPSLTIRLGEELSLARYSENIRF